VTDANSCTATTSFTVTQPTAISLTAASQTNVACFGGSTGAAAVNTATGGAGGFTYNWTPGNPTGDGTTAVTGLTAGTWTCTVTDANACTATTSFTVTQPTAISLTAASQTNVACFGGSTGAATVSASGGAGVYAYSWSPAGGNAANASGLTAGSYSVTVSDANGCSTSQGFTITQPTSVIASAVSQTNVACFGGSTGAATVSASGGTGAYTYSWSPAGGNSTTASGLSAGSYSVTVTDANGCSTSQGFTITQNPAIILQTTQLTGVSCFGGNDGAISIQASGGTSGYTYSWNSLSATTNTVGGLSAGSYQVTVSDAESCSVSQTFTIMQPSLLNVTLQPSLSVVCFGQTNSSVTALANGGIGSYAYAWSNNLGNSSVVNNIGEGTYSVQVTDANGCITNDTVTISASPLPIIDAGSDIIQCGNQPVVLSATGAAFYTWNNGVQNNVSFIPDFGTTPYLVTGTDSLGCSATDIVNVTANEIPNATITLTNNVQLVANPSNSSFQWLDCTTNGQLLGETNSVFVANQNGSYSVIVTSPEGCADTADCMIVDQVGIEEIPSTLNVNLYPNPANDHVTIVFNSSETLNLTLLNAQGQVVQFIKHAHSGEILSIQHLSKGMYVMEIDDSLGKQFKRLIIE
jgi:hypothetical protein